MEYKIAALGQTVMKVQVPLDIFMSLNRLYEQNFHNLFDNFFQLNPNNFLVTKTSTLFQIDVYHKR